MIVSDLVVDEVIFLYYSIEFSLGVFEEELFGGVVVRDVGHVEKDSFYFYCRLFLVWLFVFFYG